VPWHRHHEVAGHLGRPPLRSVRHGHRALRDVAGREEDIVLRDGEDRLLLDPAAIHVEYPPFDLQHSCQQQDYDVRSACHIDVRCDSLADPYCHLC